jgi:hypothetical protein
MKKLIYEVKIKTRVLSPSIPAVVEAYKEYVPRTVWDCDFCEAKSGDSMCECLGCGKTACYGCAREGNKNGFENLEFEIGEAGYGEGYNPLEGRPESGDHKIDSFYLCKTCRESPPKKIGLLMRYVTNLEDLWKEKYELKTVVMNEIEKVKHANLPAV